MSEINDPWLYPGCPCYVWDNDLLDKQILIFNKKTKSGCLRFSVHSSLVELVPFENYKPIGTPWDNAPPEAEFIRIDSMGNCEFLLNENDTHSLSAKIFCNLTGNIISSSYQKILITWPACPEHLKGKTWPRPEWAKE